MSVVCVRVVGLQCAEIYQASGSLGVVMEQTVLKRVFPSDLLFRSDVFDLVAFSVYEVVEQFPLRGRIFVVSTLKNRVVFNWL